MKIAPMGSEHVRAVAALHMKTLSGLLRALGGATTRAFYAGCVESPRTVAFVATDDQALLGFHACWLQHAADEIDRGAEGAFVEVVAAIAQARLLCPEPS